MVLFILHTSTLSYPHPRGAVHRTGCFVSKSHSPGLQNTPEKVADLAGQARPPRQPLLWKVHQTRLLRTSRVDGVYVPAIAKRT